MCPRAGGRPCNDQILELQRTFAKSHSARRDPLPTKLVCKDHKGTVKLQRSSKGTVKLREGLLTALLNMEWRIVLLLLPAYRPASVTAEVDQLAVFAQGAGGLQAEEAFCWSGPRHGGCH